MPAPRSPEGMRARILANMPERTGRSIEEWVEIVRERGPARRNERIQWLKGEYGLGHVYAQVVADETDRPADYAPPPPTQLLSDQYSGEKAGLRPTYERLARAAQSLGGDVQVEPRKTYVSLVRRRQFGLVQASTKNRVDLGLVLPDVEPGGRLRPAGSWGGGRVSHRVALLRPDDVDDEVVGWLRDAYERDATR